MNRHLLLLIATTNIGIWKECCAYVQHHFLQRNIYNKFDPHTSIKKKKFSGAKRLPLATRFQAAPKSDDEIIEEARINILKARRKNIRQVLRTAHGIRSLRLERGWVPEIDETTGKPVSDQKVAVSFAAFGVAMAPLSCELEDVQRWYRPSDWMRS